MTTCWEKIDLPGGGKGGKVQHWGSAPHGRFVCLFILVHAACLVGSGIPNGLWSLGLRKPVRGPSSLSGSRGGLGGGLQPGLGDFD